MLPQSVGIRRHIGAVATTTPSTTSSCGGRGSRLGAVVDPGMTGMVVGRVLSKGGRRRGGGGGTTVAVWGVTTFNSNESAGSSNFGYIDRVIVRDSLSLFSAVVTLSPLGHFVENY